MDKDLTSLQLLLIPIIKTKINHSLKTILVIVSLYLAYLNLKLY